MIRDIFLEMFPEKERPKTFLFGFPELVEEEIILYKSGEKKQASVTLYSHYAELFISARIGASTLPLSEDCAHYFIAAKKGD